MSATETTAMMVSPPREGDIRALAVTTSPSTEQDLAEFLGGASTDALANRRPVWIAFICDVAFGITFSKAIGDAVADPDLASVAGDSRCWPVPANTEWHRLIGPVDSRFKVDGSAAGILRWYPSSKQS